MNPVKIGRPLSGTEPKVSLSVSVQSKTSFQLSLWKDFAGQKPHIGLVIDRLVEHGKATAFDPSKEKPEVKHEKKKS